MIVGLRAERFGGRGARGCAAAAAELRASLERTAAALASPDLEALLACEADIERALAAMPAASTLAAEERAVVRAELDSARHALLRCRRLGASLNEFVRLSLEAQGRGAGYGRREPAYAGQSLNARA